MTLSNTNDASSVVAQVVLSGGEKGSYQSISWGWGYVSSSYISFRKQARLTKELVLA
jgi:hypothetical protein